MKGVDKRCGWHFRDKGAEGGRKGKGVGGGGGGGRFVGSSNAKT